MGKHIQEGQLKTVSGQSLTGQGDITISLNVKESNIYPNNTSDLQYDLYVADLSNETVTFANANGEWIMIAKKVKVE